jgi:SAM-dependent methyltransferase
MYSSSFDQSVDQWLRFPLGILRRKIKSQQLLFGTKPISANRIERCADIRYCNICGWSGDAFIGYAHSESSNCPNCDSIARDRFVYFLAFNAARRRTGSAVIETSPRIGSKYREYMNRMFLYRASDFDLSAHKGDIFLDLQSMTLPSSSIDVFITAHVLEHVPEPAKAAAELYRVLKPGGTAVVAVPILNGQTRVPTEPEFHEDNTPVHWRFGWDAKDLLEAAGFGVDIAVTEPFQRVLEDGVWGGDVSGEYEIDSLLQCPTSVMPAISAAVADKLGIAPPYQFVAFVCKKPKK